MCRCGYIDEVRLDFLYKNLKISEYALQFRTEYETEYNKYKK